MMEDVTAFCETLEVPKRPWQAIGVDFVGPLPASRNRHGTFDQICVIIDHLTSMVHLVPTKTTYKAERIISDRDSLFTSTFWQELHRLLGTELRLSSAYHPQTDGATERANRTSIEFAMNCARSDTTGFSPFFLNYGRMPRPLIWDTESEYPGVETFAQRMKDAIMAAHDHIIEARVKQTRQANKHRRQAEFDRNILDLF